jgi:hypothetical protein
MRLHARRTNTLHWLSEFNQRAMVLHHTASRTPHIFCCRRVSTATVENLSTFFASREGTVH